jgi:hypothetical protein
MALKFKISKRDAYIYFGVILFLFYLIYRSFPQTQPLPKQVTIADYVSWSDYVIVARGGKIHWVKENEPVEFVGPPSRDMAFVGPQLLEADIVSVMHCKRVCPNTGKVIISLEGFSGFVGGNYPIQDGHDLVGIDMIFLAKDAGFDIAKVYPKQLIGPWNVEMTDRRTAYPVSSKADIEKTLRAQVNK